MSLPIVSKINELHFISKSASEESELQHKMDTVKNMWVHYKFNMKLAHDNDPSSFVLSQVEDVMSDLDDSLSTLTTVLSSR